MGQDVTNETPADSRVGELVRHRLADLSPAERRLARVLLASYPIAGLESVARFAERAGVSPPTVTRFITKLGFRGYPEFQEVLRHEVQQRLSSPLERYRDEEAGRGAGSLLAANYLYGKATNDGLTLAMFAASAAMEHVVSPLRARRLSTIPLRSKIRRVISSFCFIWRKALAFSTGEIRAWRPHTIRIGCCISG